MKADIHPDYVVAEVRCSCGNTFITRSTKPRCTSSCAASAIPSTRASRSWSTPAGASTGSSAATATREVPKTVATSPPSSTRSAGGAARRPSCARSSRGDVAPTVDIAMRFPGGPPWPRRLGAGVGPGRGPSRHGRSARPGLGRASRHRRPPPRRRGRRRAAGPPGRRVRRAAGGVVARGARAAPRSSPSRSAAPPAPDPGPWLWRRCSRPPAPRSSSSTAWSSGEILGLEIARVVVDDTGARIEVGVGRHDREAFAMLHGDLPPEAALAGVIATVRRHRTGAAEGPTTRSSGWRRSGGCESRHRPSRSRRRGRAAPGRGHRRPGPI